MQKTEIIRSDKHANSWYTSDKKTLKNEITTFYSKIPKALIIQKLKGLIVP